MSIFSSQINVLYFPPEFSLLVVHTVQLNLQLPLGFLSLHPHRGSVASVLQSPPPLLDVSDLLSAETFSFEYSVEFLHIEGYEFFI